MIGNCFTSDTGLLVPDRKRPRKLSHKVLECTIEEVSVAHSKKKVWQDLDGRRGVFWTITF